jgi:hypothetical protein
MKFKDILNCKVVYSENVGDEYYYDYRIIVQYKNKFILIEYDDSFSGYISFKVESVSKEFIYDFFKKYDYEWNKNPVPLDLNLENTEKLQDIIDFNYDKESLEQDVILLDYEDIKEYVKVDDNIE